MYNLRLSFIWEKISVVSKKEVVIFGKAEVSVKEGHGVWCIQKIWRKYLIDIGTRSNNLLELELFESSSAGSLVVLIILSIHALLVLVTI